MAHRSQKKIDYTKKSCDELAGFFLQLQPTVYCRLITAAKPLEAFAFQVEQKRLERFFDRSTEAIRSKAATCNDFVTGRNSNDIKAIFGCKADSQTFIQSFFE